MNAKNTKRALISSVLALVLCVSMLIGTTFAWFTDSATSAVNTIQAGTLDIDIQDVGGNSLEGQTLDFVANDGRAQNLIFWEPGCTYNTQEFYIVNEGNLNLKFRFAVTGAEGDVELLDVIDLTAMVDANSVNFNTGAVSVTPAAGEKFDLLTGYEVDTLFYGTQLFTEYVLEPGDKVGPIVVTGHMQETAGNQYQGKSISGLTVSLIAAQATGEEDSFDGIYDADATYPAIVESKADLTAALSAGVPVILNADIAVDGNISLKAGATLDGNGYTLSDAQLYMGEGSTVKNVVFNGTESANGSQIYAHDVSVTVDGCTFINPAWDAIQATQGTVKDCTVEITNCNFMTDGSTYRFVHVEISKNELYTDNAVKVVLTNNHFGNIDKCTDDGITVAGIFENNVSVSGNTASAASEAAANGECWFGSKETGSWVQYNVDMFEDINIAVTNATDLETALANGGDVELGNSIALDEQVSLGAGATLNGNGNTIDVSGVGYQYDCAISTTGGTVKNVTVIGDGWTRGIGAGSSGNVVLSDDLYIDNVTIDGMLYAINGSGDSESKVIVTNSTVNGWCSFSGIAGYEFENCKLATGDSYLGYIVIYGDTSFTNCEFSEFYMGARCDGDGDVGEVCNTLAAGKSVTLTNCTYDGVDITAENFASFFEGEDDEHDFGNLKNCNVTVDGVPVVW